MHTPILERADMLVKYYLLDNIDPVKGNITMRDIMGEDADSVLNDDTMVLIDFFRTHKPGSIGH